jgi:hypothetical protein
MLLRFVNRYAGRRLRMCLYLTSEKQDKFHHFASMCEAAQQLNLRMFVALKHFATICEAAQQLNLRMFVALKQPHTPQTFPGCRGRTVRGLRGAREAPVDVPSLPAPLLRKAVVLPTQTTRLPHPKRARRLRRISSAGSSAAGAAAPPPPAPVMSIFIDSAIAAANSGSVWGSTPAAARAAASASSLAAF